MIEALLKIHLSREEDINRALELRYLLADIIEERSWATVVEESSGENGFERYLDTEEDKLKKSRK